MLIFGLGFVASMCCAVFLWFQVDLGISGVVGSLFFAFCAVISGVMMLRRTYGFVKEGRILAWFI
jgi:hypothetical protein